MAAHFAGQTIIFQTSIDQLSYIIGFVDWLNIV